MAQITSKSGRKTTEEEEVINWLKLKDDPGYAELSDAEPGSFSRNSSHPKFAKCPEQVLRKFIKGLSL